MSIIESDRYRQEEARLKADPIIIDMVEDFFVMGQSPDDLPQHDLMILALNTYKARGGEQHESIGGPVRAVKALYAEKTSA